MSFMLGKTVSGVWFEDSGPLPHEELPLNILTSFSQAMAQLADISFDKLGSIMEDEAGSTFIGPALNWNDEESCEKRVSSLQVEASGPFDSTSAFKSTTLSRAK